MKISLASEEVIHFIGIGGIGMSGLAQIMKNTGFNVQGSDLFTNKNTERLKKLGIKIFLKHNKKNVKRATLVVISSAIKKNNNELLECKKRKIPIFKRGDMLANVVALKKNIIIAGSHGKTTTTSLISNILLEAGLDPTVINGGVINSLKNSAKLGKSEWGVIESDESDGSFVNLPITYSVVTNIDQEHMDHYGDMNRIKKSFKKFIEKTPSFGKAFICLDNINTKNLLKKININNFLTYGFDKKSNYRIVNVKKKINHSTFDLYIKVIGKKKYLIKNLQINLIGEHNIQNATAAVALALNLGINIKIISKAIKKFMGIQRRFTKIFSLKQNDFFDDYAHHPTEIKSLLKGIKQVYKKRKIISVFQPHRYSRVNDLKKEFAESFKYSNEVVLCPVYSAGEKLDKNFNQFEFSKQIANKSKILVINIKNEIDLLNYFKKNLFSDELIVCMGAGSISNWIRKIANIL